MTLGVLWPGERSPLLQAVVTEVQRYSRETFPDWAHQDAAAEVGVEPIRS